MPKYLFTILETHIKVAIVEADDPIQAQMKVLEGGLEWEELPPQMTTKFEELEEAPSPQEEQPE